MCLSGGASGSDRMFGDAAAAAGHDVCHFIFPGHGSKAPKSQHVVLTQAVLNEADEALIRANGTLKRIFPTGKLYVDNLLRRNFWQQRDTGSIYAIAGIAPNGTLFGGTAWAVQMFIDRHDGGACPVYVFDQERDGWFTWNGSTWVRLNLPPQPWGVYTGIGTRTVLDNGRAAIAELFTEYL